MSEASVSSENEVVLITGAAGTIGSMLRRSLARPGRHLRLLDVAPQEPLAPGEDAELIVGSFLDVAVMADACRDANVVLHFGGLSTNEFDWDQYLDVNINGTYVLLEAARAAGVPRVIYASSNHAVGFQPIEDGSVAPDYLFPRPDSFYGVSKVASESLGSLFHDRYGLDVVCLRIGSYGERPANLRQLWSWLSPGDCVRLIEAAMATPSPGFRVVWGVSANRRSVVTLAEAHAIGYYPLDDAEEFAGEITNVGDGGGVEPPFIGGPYTVPSAALESRNLE
jgi:NAD(P)-dependent dehydrogenase (short-subunit alcohol dehydrogenase family)